MANMLTGIISITVSAVVLANVYISVIKGQNQSWAVANASGGSPVASGQWTSAETAMWGLLTLIAIVGLVYGVLSIFGLA